MRELFVADFCCRRKAKDCSTKQNEKTQISLPSKLSFFAVQRTPNTSETMKTKMEVAFSAREQKTKKRKLCYQAPRTNNSKRTEYILEAQKTNSLKKQLRREISLSTLSKN